MGEGRPVQAVGQLAEKLHKEVEKLRNNGEKLAIVEGVDVQRGRIEYVDVEELNQLVMGRR